MSETGGSIGGQVKRGAGGTPGGVAEFFFGLILAGIGGYLLFDRVQVNTYGSSAWGFGGTSTFGITLIPTLLGVGMLFFNGKSKLAWILFVGGLLFIVAGIIARMDIHFHRTSLFQTIVMLALIAGGLGLIFRSLRPH
jgi:uncharacterized protein